MREPWIRIWLGMPRWAVSNGLVPIHCTYCSVVQHEEALTVDIRSPRHPPLLFGVRSLDRRAPGCEAALEGENKICPRLAHPGMAIKQSADLRVTIRLRLDDRRNGHATPP